MHVTEQYLETSEYRKLCQHMSHNNAAILKGMSFKCVRFKYSNHI